MMARLRPSTSLTLALLIGLLALAGQWVSQRVAADVLEQTVRQREIDKVDTIAGVLRGLIEAHTDQVEMMARLLAANPLIARAMALEGADRRSALARHLEAAMRIGRVAGLEVTDAAEEVVFRAHEPQRWGGRATGWGVAEGLAGTGVVVSQRESGGVMVRAIQPLSLDGRVVGTVAAGLRLDRAFVDELSQEVGAGLALLGRQGQSFGTDRGTAGDVDRGAVDEAFLRKVPVYRLDAGTRTTHAYLPVTIVDEAYVILARIDSRSAYQVLDDGKRRAAMYGALTTVVSILLGLLALRLALRPLHRLRERAERTAVDLTGAAIDSAGADEVGSVVKVLETLTDRLVQRNAELVEATRAADAASQAKSHFLSAMSHEIRTPLNGVLGMAELLRRTRLDEQQARHVQAIDTAGRMLHDLLSDVLDLAKIEEGQAQLERVDFDVGRLLTDLGAVYREMAAARGLAMRLDLQDLDGQWVSGDPTRLRQVLSNLLGNAVKFTLQGHVGLASRRLAAPDGDVRAWWRFAVEDSGIGISAAAQATLFQRFVQADASTTRQFGGTGLGLSICKHLIEMMGGRIGLDSQPGRGARFHVDLPFEPAVAPVLAPVSAPVSALVPAPLPALVPPPVPARPPRAPASQPTAARVLVAEDNPVNQQVISGLLGWLGVEVTLAGDGAQALAWLQKAPFDLVFMDCQMPVMDGFESTRRIRVWEQGQPGRGPVPIVALTANALAGDREACLAAGMTGYVAKPLTSAALEAALAQHLPASARSAAVGQGSAAAEAPSDTAPAVFDRRVLEALPMVADGSDPAFADQMVDLFIEGAGPLIDTLDQAQRQGLREAQVRAVHTLASGAGQVGALALAGAALALEQGLRAGDTLADGAPARLRQAVDRLADEVARSRSASRRPKVAQ